MPEDIGIEKFGIAGHKCWFNCIRAYTTAAFRTKDRIQKRFH